MALVTPHSPSLADAHAELDVADGVLDLTDRRRVLLRVVFGVDASPTAVDRVFDPTDGHSSTTD